MTLEDGMGNRFSVMDTLNLKEVRFGNAGGVIVTGTDNGIGDDGLCQFNTNSCKKA